MWIADIDACDFHALCRSQNKISFSLRALKFYMKEGPILFSLFRFLRSLMIFQCRCAQYLSPHFSFMIAVPTFSKVLSYCFEECRFTSPASTFGFMALAAGNFLGFSARWCKKIELDIILIVALFAFLLYYTLLFMTLIFICCRFRDDAATSFSRLILKTEDAFKKPRFWLFSYRLFTLSCCRRGPRITRTRWRRPSKFLAPRESWWWHAKPAAARRVLYLMRDGAYLPDMRWVFINALEAVIFASKIWYTFIWFAASSLSTACSYFTPSESFISNGFQVNFFIFDRFLFSVSIFISLRWYFRCWLIFRRRLPFYYRRKPILYIVTSSLPAFALLGYYYATTFESRHYAFDVFRISLHRKILYCLVPSVRTAYFRRALRSSKCLIATGFGAPLQYREGRASALLLSNLSILEEIMSALAVRAYAILNYRRSKMTGDIAAICRFRKYDTTLAACRCCSLAFFATNFSLQVRGLLRDRRCFYHTKHRRLYTIS